ncbi:(2Fe-2S)-binding protein [Streptomyces sp. NPDC005648]|uniref:(2Fe-2S)-binding protein n=1 Tax=Streptomyces sp. NPDC005648 TaxID=3157044 RepID=UPI0033A50A51
MPSYSFDLNGEKVTVEAPTDMPLLWVLRDLLHVTGPKYGCGIGVCRACTSHLDGEEIQPCTVKVRDCAGRTVTTIEGLADGDTLHPVQEAWLDCDVAQCGFCQPGQIMAAAALLKRTPHPSDADIDRIENVCRCGTYTRIREAINKAAAKITP